MGHLPLKNRGYRNLSFSKDNTQVGKMAEQVDLLAAKSANLSFILGIVKGMFTEPM